MNNFNVGDWVQATSETLEYYHASDFFSLNDLEDKRDEIMDTLAGPMLITYVDPAEPEEAIDEEYDDMSLYGFTELPFALFGFELEEAR